MAKLAALPWRARRRRLVAAAVIIVVGLVGIDLLIASTRPAATTLLSETTFELHPMEVTRLEAQNLQQVVQITGSLAPTRQAALRAQVAATVEDVLVRNGEAVEQGDVLVTFDTADVEARLRQQQETKEAMAVQHRLAQATLDRNQALVKRGVITQATLEQYEAEAARLQAQLSALEAQVGTAERSLENGVVKAPFSGWIVARAVTPGESVAVGAPLMTLVDLSVLEVQATVPTSEVAGVRPGQKAGVTVEGIDDRAFTATVDRIAPVAIEGTRSVPVYLLLDNAGDELRGGMFVSGSIILQQETGVIVLPPSAVHEDDIGHYVLKVIDDQVVRQSVAVGPQWPGSEIVKVESGLAPGDIVVTVALPQLAPGSKVSLRGG
jgi:RND family efflux transporter MFP subunit